MIKRLITILLSFILCIVCNAQSKVTGVVTDSIDSQPLYNCSVLLKSPQGKTVNFAFTDTAGMFSFKVPNPAGMSIEVSMIGYSKKKIHLKATDTPLKIALKPEAFTLKDVSVKASPINERGDTLTYSVSSFANESDRTIGDVLKRMPGIEVNREGRISFQGSEISRFYIEGGNLLEGRYGIATNGISHEDVGAVEVLQHHQPMQVLQGFFKPETAAINLKLKSGSKATWVYNGKAGGGISDNPKGGLWLGEAFAMAAMPGYQSIITLKSDNTGLEPENELTDFTAAKRNTQVEDYFSLSHGGAGAIDFKRYNFNRSALASVNNLWKLKNGYEIKNNIDYSYDRSQTSTSRNISYFLEDGDRTILENSTDISRDQRLTASVSIEANEKNFYLNNKLHTELQWNSIDLANTGTLSNSQRAKLPDMYLSNDIKVYRKFGGKHLVTFKSTNEWESRDNSLTVSQQDGSYWQRLRNSTFYTNENASYTFLLHGLSIALTGGIEGMVRRLSGDSGNDNLGQLNGNAGYFKVSATPNIVYSFRQVELTFNCPLGYNLYSFHGHIPDQNIFIYNPSLSARMNLARGLSLSIGGSHGNSTINLANVYSGVVMKDYRSYQRGYPAFPTTKRSSLRGILTFQRTKQGVFSNLMVIQTWNVSPYRTVQDLEGDYLYNSYERADTKGRMFMAMFNISKTLPFIHGGVGLNTIYDSTSRKALSQGKNIDFTSRSFSAKVSANSRPIRGLSMTYSFKYACSALKMGSVPSDGALGRFTHDFSVTVSPIKRWSMIVHGEVYRNEVTDDNYASICLLDAKLRFRPTKRLEIAATLTNLLNKSAYSYTTYGMLNATEYTTHLRGRELMLTVILKK